MVAITIGVLLFIAFMGVLALIFLILALNLYKAMMRESANYHIEKMRAGRKEQVT